MSKSYNEVKKHLSPDGALRDFYIKDITPSHWDRFLAYIQDKVERYSFRWYDKQISLPKRYSEIKKLQEENPTILTIWITGQAICCYFFNGF